MTESTLQLVLAALVLISVVGAFVAICLPYLSGRAKSDRRLANLAAGGKQGQDRSSRNGRRRMRNVAETVKHLESSKKSKAKSRQRMTLRTRLRQAGLSWSKPHYGLVCLVCGALTFLIFSTALGAPVGVTAIGGLCGAVLLPHLYVSYRRRLRFKAFGDEFANALDIIVRGVKAGLPLIECFKIIASEAAEPLKSEVQALIDDQSVGIPLDEATKRLADRVPMAETFFLAVVLSVQNRTGGSLSDALGNLSAVLRDRKRMEGKIKAMSAEARVSAMIIGSLPAIVMAILFVTSREYVLILFESRTGNLVLLGSAMWMMIGVFVMRKMIHFDY